MLSTLQRWFNAKVISILPIFIAVNLASLGIYFFGVSIQAMPIILGMIAAALVDFDGTFLGRVKNIFAMLLTFGITTILVQFTLHYSIYFSLLLTMMAFIVTMLGAIGARYNGLAFGALIIAIYAVLTHSPMIPEYLNPLLLIFGALIYSLCSLLLFLFFPLQGMQENLATLFENLGQFMQQKAKIFSLDNWQNREELDLPLAINQARVVQSFNQCQAILFYRLQGRLPLKIKQRLNIYFAAQEIFERLSGVVLANDVEKTLVQKLQHTDIFFRLQNVLDKQGIICQKIAQSLQTNHSFHYPDHLSNALEQFEQAMSYHQQHHLNTLNKDEWQALQTVLTTLKGIDWQLRNLFTHRNEERAAVNAVQVSGLKNCWLAIKNNLTIQSPLFRHAVRFSVVVFSCSALIEIFQLHLGYWILMTAILVCQPNHYATKIRLKQRVIGSVIGVLVGSFLPFLNPALPISLGVIVVSSALFFFFRHNHYSYATFFITVQVLMSFYVMGFNINDAIVSRLIYTIIGAGIAFLATSLIWSDWKFWKLYQSICSSISSQSDYLLFIVTQFQFGRCDPLKYRIVRRKAQDNASRLSDLIYIMQSDPKHYAKRLPTAFRLWKQNDQLFNTIATLGAYRVRMQQVQQGKEFVHAFYPTAKELINLLQQLPYLSESQFNSKWQNLQIELNQTLETNHTITMLAWKQLQRIASHLPELYQDLLTEKPEEKQC